MTTDPRQLAQEALALDTAAQDAHPSTPVGALAQLERLGRLYDMCQPLATALLAALDERDKLRLTLAAEQGKPEGAPSDGWEFDGRDWNKNYTDGSFAGLSGRRGKRRWMRAQWPDTERAPHYLGRGHDVETDRAAMLAADAATAPCAGPAPASTALPPTAT